MTSIPRPLSITLLASAALVAALLIALGAATKRPAEAAAPAVEELVIRAADFAFVAPRSAPAGLTRIRLMNDGPTAHHVQLVRLDRGHTAAEYLQRLAARDFAPAFATFVGGPESPGRRGESEATLLLTEGEYLVICLISGGDGVPHVAMGMHFPLTVTAPRYPEADVRMVLREYDFDITPEIRAGRHTLRIENEGKQPHHVAIMRLSAGRSAEDVLHWAREMKGEPPHEAAGGTSAIAPGQVNYVTADFAPGEYALICFVPDPRDGKSHAHHGMVRTITVRG